MAQEGSVTTPPPSKKRRIDAPKRRSKKRCKPGQCYIDQDGDKIHIATKWQTPTEIAAKYNVDIDELVAFNQDWHSTQVQRGRKPIHAEAELEPGTSILINFGSS